MSFHDPPRLPRGFSCAARCCGLKADESDLSLFFSDVPAEAAAIFTRNRFPGAPIVVGRERLSSGRLQAVVANSKISNVATGEEGLEDAREMGRMAARELGISEELVLMSSTGLIGRRLPMEKIEAGLRGMPLELAADPWPAARGIMTTDTEPKALSLEVGGATLTAVGKGSGMIAPNLATMLVFIFTDAAFPAATLRALLVDAAAQSFQCLSIDSDTSTSDTVAILANGRAGEVDETAFRHALDRISLRMAEWLARDGEGATKLVRVRVTGAATDAEAATVARSVIDSPLIKTMAYGADPNVGRIFMAVGKCVDCRIEPESLCASLQGVPVITDGRLDRFEESHVRKLLQRDPVEIEIDLGVGPGMGLGLGCDLTEGYVTENAAYSSS
jgi:glutamate N-acetyltransferase/amino-acid N-acetyltransferase